MSTSSFPEAAALLPVKEQTLSFAACAEVIPRGFGWPDAESGEQPAAPMGGAPKRCWPGREERGRRQRHLFGAGGLEPTRDGPQNNIVQQQRGRQQREQLLARRRGQGGAFVAAARSSGAAAEPRILSADLPSQIARAAASRPEPPAVQEVRGDGARNDVAFAAMRTRVELLCEDSAQVSAFTHRLSIEAAELDRQQEQVTQQLLRRYQNLSSTTLTYILRRNAASECSSNDDPDELRLLRDIERRGDEVSKSLRQACDRLERNDATMEAEREAFKRSLGASPAGQAAAYHALCWGHRRRKLRQSLAPQQDGTRVLLGRRLDQWAKNSAGQELSPAEVDKLSVALLRSCVSRVDTNRLVALGISGLLPVVTKLSTSREELQQLSEFAAQARSHHSHHHSHRRQSWISDTQRDPEDFEDMSKSQRNSRGRKFAAEIGGTPLRLPGAESDHLGHGGRLQSI